MQKKNLIPPDASSRRREERQEFLYKNYFFGFAGGAALHASLPALFPTLIPDQVRNGQEGVFDPLSGSDLGWW